MKASKLGPDNNQQGIIMTSACDPGLLHPREARAEFRKNNLTHISCSQFCAGYLQANIACFLSNMADDFELLCVRTVVHFLISTAVNRERCRLPLLISGSG